MIACRSRWIGARAFGLLASFGFSWTTAGVAPGRGASDLYSRRGADPPGKVPRVPPDRPGRAVLAGHLRAGPEAVGGHRVGGRGSEDAALEAGPGRRPEAQVRPLARPGGGRPAPGVGRRRARPEDPGPRATDRDILHRGVEARNSRSRPRTFGGLRRPRLGSGPLPLLRDPDQPAGRCLRLGRRVPARERSGRASPDGVRRGRRTGTEARRGRGGARLHVVLGRGGRGSSATSAAGHAGNEPPATSPKVVGRSLLGAAPT